MNSRVIRLRQKGRLKVHSFDIVVVHRRLKRGKSGLGEKIGFIQPKFPRIFLINSMRLAFWLNKGAELHPTVRKYLGKMAGTKRRRC
jgi:ribosomal protein S16